MKRLFFLMALLALAPLALAQKKPLDHTVYDSWQSVGATSISPKGNVLSYEVNPQEGDGVLTLRVMGKKGREITIERGYQARILDDETYAVCLIKPEFAKTRKARIDKKKPDEMPQDSLAVIDLATGAVSKFADVKGYKMGKYAKKAFAFSSADTTFLPPADRKKKEKLGQALVVYRFADARLDTLQQVDQYQFSKDGERLALVRKLGKKAFRAAFYDIETGRLDELPDSCAWISVPQFNESGTEALFLTAPDTLDSGSKHASLQHYDWAAGKIETLITPDRAEGLHKGWGLTENSTCSFSHDGKNIFTSIQEYTPPKDTTLVPFETPGLDIWNWDSELLPPVVKAGRAREASLTFPVQVLKDGNLRLLNDRRSVRFFQGNRGDSPYNLRVAQENPIAQQWTFQGSASVLLDTPEGTCEIVKGQIADPALSPLARHVVWWDPACRSWKLYEIASGVTRTLLEGAGVAFWNEEDDHPSLPEPYGLGGWLEGDEALLVYDFYDIWKVPADGSAPVRLTDGRSKGLTYRYLNLKDQEEERHVGKDQPILLSVFDNATKENGLACIQVSKPEKSFRTLVKGGYSWTGVKKAREADVYTYLKGNFNLPMDVYYTQAFGKTEQKLTAINPQMADYSWGTAELYHWTAYDGKQLDGLLYKPENLDESKKYPVLIYFYEKSSETLYRHIPAQPSWSTINIAFYVSRGYVVFVPDIVYTSGLPGESAVNCICSGAESLTRFPWIDKDNMAVQGQSWGGYQVAYLITRTNMFKAAGAGAPVSNMTSAYGGIRWESGSSRQAQYEEGQSRIGRDLWNGTELYLENSALFKLPNVTTPVLIMHNDADGAVPWYQGIELFMGLRRLGKPAWLLEYNDEAHNLRERRNRKDLTIRLQQFFDHYLKGEPAPAWMTEGVPTLKKDWYFGYELPE